MNHNTREKATKASFSAHGNIVFLENSRTTKNSTVPGLKQTRSNKQRSSLEHRHNEQSETTQMCSNRRWMKRSVHTIEYYAAVKRSVKILNEKESQNDVYFECGVVL
jgi:hypothetical protein